MVIYHRCFAETLDETIAFLALVLARYAVDAKRHLEETEPTGIRLLTDIKAVVSRFLLLALARQAYLRQHDLVVFQKARRMTCRQHGEQCY